MERSSILFFVVVFSLLVTVNCTSEGIVYYDCPTAQVNKALSEKKAAFDNNPTVETCQAYFTDLNQVFKECKNRVSKDEAQAFQDILDGLQPCSQFDE